MAGQGEISLSGYSICEVEFVTGVKQHILRYWEEMVPSLAPRMDAGGHRLYTQREVDIIRRMKFLIYSRGLSVDGAWKKIVQESSGHADTDVLVAIRKCRAGLNDAYMALRKIK